MWKIISSEDRITVVRSSWRMHSLKYLIYIQPNYKSEDGFQFFDAYNLTDTHILVAHASKIVTRSQGLTFHY